MALEVRRWCDGRRGREPHRKGTPIVAQRINAERLVLLGWTRAILLQLAHPLIAAGVYDHSSFRAAPFAAASRLHATIRAMLTLSFGTDAEREHALHGIRTIHTRVNGHLRHAVGVFPAGARYSAEDPALVLWVHLTLIESVRQDPRRRRLFANDGGHRRAVTEPIDVVVAQTAAIVDPHAAGHALHVWMRGVHAAVDDRNRRRRVGARITS